jgi:post-segregation antitoxin (ccd killing protein)
MAKMQVYLPAGLYERVKARGDSINVSQILQGALEEELVAIERREALSDAVRAHESRRGRFTDEELAGIEARDRAAARRPRGRRRVRTRAA